MRCPEADCGRLFQRKQALAVHLTRTHRTSIDEYHPSEYAEASTNGHDAPDGTRVDPEEPESARTSVLTVEFSDDELDVLEAIEFLDGRPWFEWANDLLARALADAVQRETVREAVRMRRVYRNAGGAA